MFTMARDGRLPFSRHIAHVSGRSKTPVIPALFIGILTLILLVINIGNQRVFLVLTSVAIIMFYIPYMCVTVPLLLKRMRGNWPRPEHGPYFSMGRFGLPLNIIAVLYQTAVVINLAWPRPDVYGSDHWFFQWGAFVFVGGVAILGGCYYFIRHHGRISEVLSEHRALAAPEQPMGEPPLTAQA
jgi:amino acid transporter